MGEKGAKHTAETAALADDVLIRLGPLGDVTAKRMFGGYGIFESGVMFAIISPDARLFLRADDSTVAAYHDAGSEKHGRMPYYEIPEAIAEDDTATLAWASTARDVAHDAKK